MNKRLNNICLLLIGIFSATFSIGQNIKINDTVYLNIIQDTSTKDNALNKKSSYKIGVYLSGFLYKEVIEAKKGHDKIYFDTVSTWDKKDVATYKADRRFFLKIRKKCKHGDFWIFHNGNNVNIPFKYGYSILNIRIDYDYDKSKRPITIYNFIYSNKLPAGI